MPRTVQIEAMVVDGDSLTVGTLAEDQAAPGTFICATPDIVLTVTNSTNHGTGAPDFWSVTILHGDLPGREITANLVEDGDSSNRFVSPHLGGLAGGGGDRVPSVQEVVQQHGFKVRVTDHSASGNTYTVALLGKLDTGGYKVMGVVEATQVSPGIYESDVNLNVADLDELPEPVAQDLDDYNLLHGSGSGLKIIIGGIAVGVV